jgi:hypothetical protein
LCSERKFPDTAIQSIYSEGAEIQFLTELLIKACR